MSQDDINPAENAAMTGIGKGKGFCPKSGRKGALKGCQDPLKCGPKTRLGRAWMRAWHNQDQDESEYWLQYQCDLEEELAHVKEHNKKLQRDRRGEQ